MFATRGELLEKIHLGESSFLELKEVRFAGSKIRGPRQDDLADELASFANSRGGVLVLGVHDTTREIVGIPQPYLGLVERFVHQLCHDAIEPPIAPIIDLLRLSAATGEDVAVIKIDVPRSLFVHRSPGGFLYRVGSTKRVMSPEYLARLFQQRSQARIIRFDEQVVSRAGLDDLQPVLWERFLTPLSRDERDDFLAKLHMVRTDDEGTLRPTVAGVLMAYLQSARNEIITSLLAKCPVPPDEEWLMTDRRTLMDKRGEGVPIIMENSERLSGRLPEYRLIGESELMLTIWAADVS